MNFQEHLLLIAIMDDELIIRKWRDQTQCEIKEAGLECNIFSSLYQFNHEYIYVMMKHVWIIQTQIDDNQQWKIYK